MYILNLFSLFKLHLNSKDECQDPTLRTVTMAKQNRVATMVLHGQQYGVGCNEIYWSRGGEGVKLVDSEGSKLAGLSLPVRNRSTGVSKLKSRCQTRASSTALLLTHGLPASGHGLASIRPQDSPFPRLQRVPLSLDYLP